jgi:UDP-3-O-[3-hydroxymyristoyl] glucosamine N-acyltransferase
LFQAVEQALVPLLFGLLGPLGGPAHRYGGEDNYHGFRIQTHWSCASAPANRRRDIAERLTFHSLKDTEIRIGNGLTTGNNVTLHGPLEVGDNLRVGDRGVVFRVRVGDDVTVGEGAIVAGPAGEELELEIPDGTNIPDGAVITNQEELDAILEQQG